MKLFAVLFIATCLSFSTGSFLKPGDTSPEISLPNADGELISLSSLQGDIVLVDFWASWCAPCKRKRPGLVKVYNEFKNSEFKNGEGFQIYSISLDKNKESWMKAIQEQKLSWPYHVSDLNGWESEAARTFGVKSIPFNLLLDRNGTIIGRNYSSEELNEVLTALK